MRQCRQLAEAATEAFRQHPDHAIVTSFPCQADVTGARVLAEIGDDPPGSLMPVPRMPMPGAAPITRASGPSISITHCKVRNDRLAAAGYLWAFVAAAHAEPAKQHYQRRQTRLKLYLSLLWVCTAKRYEAIYPARVGWHCWA